MEETQEVQETSEEIQLRIYPSPQGVVFNLGGKPFTLSQNDTWTIIGNLVSASIMTQIQAADAQDREEEELEAQRERIRRLIESGSNLKDV